MPNRQTIVKPVLIGTPTEMLQMIEALHTLLLTNAITSNSAAARINERLKLLFASTNLSIIMSTHSLCKIYANWAYLATLAGNYAYSLIVPP